MLTLRAKLLLHFAGAATPPMSACAISAKAYAPLWLTVSQRKRRFT
jgi:hypothetical protein